MAERLEFPAQLEKIVYLAVVGDEQIAGGARHRLGAGGEIDDGEPPMSEPQARQQGDAAAVRAAVAQCLVHAEDRSLGRRMQPAEVDDAGDPTHQLSRLGLGCRPHAGLGWNVDR